MNPNTPRVTVTHTLHTSHTPNNRNDNCKKKTMTSKNFLVVHFSASLFPPSHSLYSPSSYSLTNAIQ